MTPDLLLALASFAFVSSITPGPNNLMLMSSGANFGFRRSIPHMLGIGVGFVVMLILVGLGAMGLFAAFPVLHLILKILSVVYLLYLAWRIANAAPPGQAAQSQTATSRPFTFLQAAAFQWVNPKAWSMALTAITVYAPDRSPQTIVLVGLIFGAINLPSVSTWTILGQQLRRILRNPDALRLFNWTMAALLVASLVPVLWP